MSAPRAVYGSFTEVSYEPDPEITFEDWSDDVFVMSRGASRLPFYLGDAIIYGQNRFGEAYSQALDPDLLGLEMQTIYNYVWVCRAIPAERRRPELSWEHHKIVASQVPDLQEYWLARAVDEGMSTRGLKDAMKGKAPPEIAANEFTRSRRVLLGEFLLLPLVSNEDRKEWLGALTDKEKGLLMEIAEDAISTLDELVTLIGA